MSPYLVFLLALFSCVQALPSTFTFVKCKTLMGKSSVVNIKTTTKTQFMPPWIETRRVVITPTIFVTPAPITKTITRYVSSTVYTTAPAITDIISTTTLYSTITDQTVETVNSTTLTSTVVISSTEISAIPTPTGFRFVADTTGSVFPVNKRAITYPHDPKNPLAIRRDRPFGMKQSFPRSVSCVAKIFVKTTTTLTKTAKPTTFTIKPSKIPITVSSIIFITSTVVPHVSNIKTVQSVETLTTTSTTTEYFVATSTDTVITTVTSYDACATPNLLGPLANGDVIDNIYNQGINQPSSFTVETAASPYDCCVACITSTTCTGSGFNIAQGSCSLFNNGADTCGVQSSSSGLYITKPGSSSSGSIVVSNGYCGYLYNGGTSP